MRWTKSKQINLTWNLLRLQYFFPGGINYLLFIILISGRPYTRHNFAVEVTLNLWLSQRQSAVDPTTFFYQPHKIRGAHVPITKLSLNRKNCLICISKKQHCYFWFWGDKEDVGKYDNSRYIHFLFLGDKKEISIIHLKNSIYTKNNFSTILDCRLIRLMT